MKSGKVNWSQVIEVIRNEIIPFFESQGVKPTLRTIFYALVSRNVIPNTKSSYKTLSRKLVKARQQGIFEWDFIEDKVRYVVERFDDYMIDESRIERTKVRAKERLEEINIKELIDDWFDFIVPSTSIGFWANQPIIPEIWIEKEALVETIKNWVWDLEINIRVNRGYSSWTFIYENVKALRSILQNHEKVVVLYLGDLDPSGVDIERFLKEALEYFNILGRVELVRVAVTEEQVEKYGLPPRPEDAETLAKLQRDPRYKSYTRKYIVELDALIAYVPEEFRKILRETILKYHNEEIYEECKKKAKEIREKCRKIVEEYKKEALRKILEEAKKLLGES